VFLFKEFEEFADDCFEELVVVFEETGVLADDLHDVAGDAGLVVLATLLFAEHEQFADGADDEAALVPLIQDVTQTSDAPGEFEQLVFTPDLFVQLVLEFVDAVGLEVSVVHDGEVLDEGREQVVEVTLLRVVVLDPDHHAVFVQGQAHLLRPHHAEHH